MPSPRPTVQTLECHNGHHEWTRPPRRGPKPSSCPSHPAPITDASSAPSADEVATLSLLSSDDLERLATEEAIADLQRAVVARARSAAFRRILAARQARRDRGLLVPEDRSHQQIRAAETEAHKQAAAAAWIRPEDDLRDDLRAEDEDVADGLRYRTATVYEGARSGQDALSRDVRQGAMHTSHPRGTSAPDSCAECYLAANDPEHLVSRT